MSEEPYRAMPDDPYVAEQKPASGESGLRHWFVIDGYILINYIRALVLYPFMEALLYSKETPATLAPRVRTSLTTTFSTIGVIAALFVGFTFSSYTSAALSGIPDQTDPVGYTTCMLLAFLCSLYSAIACAGIVTLIAYFPDKTLISSLKHVKFILALPLLAMEAAFDYLILAILFVSEQSFGNIHSLLYFVRFCVAMAFIIQGGCFMLIAMLRKERLAEMLNPPV